MNAPEGKDPDGPGPGGAVPRKNGGGGGDGGGGGGDGGGGGGGGKKTEKTTKTNDSGRGGMGDGDGEHAPSAETHTMQPAGAAGGGGRVNAPEGKDAGAGAGEGNSSDDAAEEKDTHARDDELKARMEEEGFGINATPCGPRGRPALLFALGMEGEDHDALAVKRALAALDLDVNATIDGQTALWMQCCVGRSRNVKSSSSPIHELT